MYPFDVPRLTGVLADAGMTGGEGAVMAVGCCPYARPTGNTQTAAINKNFDLIDKASELIMSLKNNPP